MKNLLKLVEEPKISIIIVITFMFLILNTFVKAQGTLTNITFYSNSLDTTRNVQVYLPPDYNPNNSKRYPVIYFLHGATQNHTAVPELAGILNDMINNYIISPVIVVKPDGSVGPWAGSMYTNSELYGNFEDYIVYDLVEFIDSTYKTIPNRNKRAIWGGSMGGYGSMKLAIKHPDIYRAVAAHSGPLDFSHFVDWVSTLLTENGGAPVNKYIPTPYTYTWLFYTAAGAFSPNLANAPFYADFPLDPMGNFIDSIYNRWQIHNPVRLASQLPLNSDLAIYFDCGKQDELFFYPFNQGFADSLDLFGIDYIFESFNGTHSSETLKRIPVALRFIDSVLNKYGNIYAIQPSIDKPYVRKSIDSILFRTTFTNIYNHQFTPHLIYANSDNTKIDSITLYDDGFHGDSLSNDGIYGGYIPPQKNEDYYFIGVSTIDNFNNKYFNTMHISRFTTVGPVTIDSISYIKGSYQYYYIRLFIKNQSMLTTIKNAGINIFCDESWVTGVTGIKLPVIPPDTTVGSSTWSIVNYDSTFPGYFNLKFEIMSDGWVYWIDSMHVIISPTGIDKQTNQPLTFNLEQNYPNPFNPTTKIKYSIPNHSLVTLKVFDILGREIETLINEEKTAGIYEINFDASQLSSGIYFYQIKATPNDRGAGDFIQTKKMILLK